MQALVLVAGLHNVAAVSAELNADAAPVALTTASNELRAGRYEDALGHWAEALGVAERAGDGRPEDESDHA